MNILVLVFSKKKEEIIFKVHTIWTRFWFALDEPSYNPRDYMHQSLLCTDKSFIFENSKQRRLCFIIICRLNIFQGNHEISPTFVEQLRPKPMQYPPRLCLFFNAFIFYCVVRHFSVCLKSKTFCIYKTKKNWLLSYSCYYRR